MDWSSYRAVLFDLDGVLTPTADVHMRAWSRMFNDFLADVPGQAPYTDDDYFSYVDGKPRYDGVRDFLASRGIELPEGTPEDAVTQQSVCGLGNRKNEEFNNTLARDGVDPYPGSAHLVADLAAAGIAMAVVSSSKNARPVLVAAGLTDYFPIVVDGVVAREEGLPGKPAPDTYQRAARLLGADPEECVVVEDAISGVQSGAAGGFGLVVGVDRGVGAEELRAHGATLVVNDLEELRQA